MGLDIMKLQETLKRRYQPTSMPYVNQVNEAEDQRATTSSSIRQAVMPSAAAHTPILPPPSMMPITEPPKETIGLLDYKRVVTLSSKITPELANRFYVQSRRADFDLPWTKCVLEEALDYIRIRLVDFKFVASMRRR